MNNAIHKSDIVKIAKASKIKQKNWEKARARFGNDRKTLKKFLRTRDEKLMIKYFGDDLDTDVTVSKSEIIPDTYHTEYDRIEVLEAAIELMYPIDIIEAVLFESNHWRFERIMYEAREKYL